MNIYQNFHIQSRQTMRGGLKFRGKFWRVNQSGQTLIETLAALFILVMGVSAAAGLAIYALGTSSNITKQIIATGLAREGLEAVRNMRDTNWLNDTLATVQTSSGCYNYVTSLPNGSACYPHWLGTGGGPPFCIDPGNGASCQGNQTTMNYYLTLNDPGSNSNPNANQYALWNFQAKPGNSGKWGMTLNQSNSGTGFYTQDGNTNCGTNSDYCREIIITKDSTDAPYNQDPNMPLLKVQSLVWWTDKNCPRSDQWPANGKCSVELDTFLTNWKQS